MEALLRIVRGIDAISMKSGKVLAWLNIPLIGGLVYEVFARYAFHAPTDWAYDVTYMLYGTLFMMGAAYTLYKKGHIRTDLLYNNLSARTQGVIDAVFYLFFFFPGMILFLIAGWDYAARSWMMKEAASMSPWHPPIYPFKTVIPLTAILLIIQGVSEFIKSLHAVIRKEWP